MFACLFALGAAALAQQTPPETSTPPATPPLTTLTADQRKEVLDSISTFVSTRAFVPGVDFARWNEFVEKRRESIEASDTVSTFTREVNRALREFGFSHINLRTPSASANRRSGSAVVLGLSTRPVEDGLEVTAVVANSPAADAGFKVGDIVLEVNGAKPTSSESLRPEEGQTLAVKVKRPTGEQVEVSMQARRMATAREDTLTWPEKNVALLKIHSFSNGYDQRKIENHLDVAAKAELLILDLRSNGGGATTNMNHLLSLLLPDATPFGVFVNRRMADQFKEATKKDPTDPVEIAKWSERKTQTRKRSLEPFKGKVVVLVNRGSASASEIVACALREHKAAPLIGQRTAGAVLASVYGRLPHGFELQYPVSDYVSMPAGIRIEGNPLQPDIEALPNRDLDEGIAKAIEWFKKPIG